MAHLTTVLAGAAPCALHEACCKSDGGGARVTLCHCSGIAAVCVGEGKACEQGQSTDTLPTAKPQLDTPSLVFVNSTPTAVKAVWIIPHSGD